MTAISLCVVNSRTGGEYLYRILHVATMTSYMLDLVTEYSNNYDLLKHFVETFTISHNLQTLGLCFRIL